MTYTITTNDTYKSTEVLFDSKPSAAVRDALKALRYRWHSVRGVWYGYHSEEEVRAAIDTAEEGKPLLRNPGASQKVKTAPESLHGVKVGDLFVCSWGYEQTNVDFLQVVALVGKSSVRVRAVTPRIVDEQDVSGMSADRVYANTGEILPVTQCSVFGGTTEEGDLHRLSVDSERVTFSVKGYTFYKYNGEKLYVSWYA